MPCRTAKARKRKRGFNLIEAAIVLGVVGLIIGAIWVAAANIRQKQQVNTMVSGVLTISENVRKIYKNIPFPLASESDFTAAMISANVVPPSLLSNGQPMTPWGEPFYLYPVPAPSAYISINFGNRLFGSNCRLFSAALFGVIRTQIERGLVEFDIDDTTISASEDVTTVMEYCTVNLGDISQILFKL